MMSVDKQKYHFGNAQRFVAVDGTDVCGQAGGSPKIYAALRNGVQRRSRWTKPRMISEIRVDCETMDTDDECGQAGELSRN